MPRGTPLALHGSVRCAAVFASAFLMSCLVTDTIQLPEERNFPPSVISPDDARLEGTSFDQIVVFDVADEEVELVLPVIVRDPNLDQTLEYQLWLDFTGNNVNALVSDGTLSPVGAFERSTTMRIPATRLVPAPSCHRVELLVTGAFDRGTRFRDPVEPGDLSQTVWWVRVIDSINNPGGNAIDLSSCP
ncbi:MAG: hypothetical protein KF901_29610 [Myxococcales bacterium]|nr:hypothetical protein [Myxococcales bacterium]